jgi:hypothetical protein
MASPVAHVMVSEGMGLASSFHSGREKHTPVISLLAVKRLCPFGKPAWNQ